jgi:hypothetical protein
MFAGLNHKNYINMENEVVKKDATTVKAILTSESETLMARQITTTELRMTVPEEETVSESESGSLKVPKIEIVEDTEGDKEKPLKSLGGDPSTPGGPVNIKPPIRSIR